MSYAESSGDEDEDVFVSMARNRAAHRKRMRSTVIDDDDEYDEEAAVENGDDDGWSSVPGSCPTTMRG